MNQPIIMFKHPFSFEGRIRRTEYGLTLLIHWLITMGLNALFGKMSLYDLMTLKGVLWLSIVLPIAWFWFAQGAKRCHDRENSGWFQLIPFYGLWMLFAEGDPGPNAYGEDPKHEQILS